MQTTRSTSRFAARLTYANVVATLALFLALGGVSWAATKLPRNSVSTSTLKDGSVTSSKVKNGSLQGRDFANRSIESKQLSSPLQSAIADRTADSSEFAARADSAARAENVIGLQKIVDSYRAGLLEAQASAPKYLLARNGDVSLEAMCYFDPPSHSLVADVRVSSESDDASASAASGMYSAPLTNFGPATAFELRRVIWDYIEASPSRQSYNTSNLRIYDVHGRGILVDVRATLKRGDSPILPYLQSEQCAFEVVGIKIN